MPVEVNYADMLAMGIGALTSTIIWALVHAFLIILGNLLAVGDGISHTLWPDKLIVASAGSIIHFDQFPLLEATHGEVLSKQHVESGVDSLQRVITNEYHGIEPI